MLRIKKSIVSKIVLIIGLSLSREYLITLVWTEETVGTKL